MIKIALIALLLLSQTLAQDSVSLLSGDTSAVVIGQFKAGDLPTTSPIVRPGTGRTDVVIQTLSKSTPTYAQPSNWNFLQLKSILGDNQKWISPAVNFALKPKGYGAVYTITFFTDCLQNGVTLNFAATGISYVQLNGQWIFQEAAPYPTQFRVEVQRPILRCGCNTFKIYVYNSLWQSPAALIYRFSQTTAGCYNCENMGVKKCGQTNLTYFEKPYLIKELPLNFSKEIVNYSEALPKTIRAVEAHFLIFLHSGGGNQDALFQLCFKDTEGPTRKWVMGHGYDQKAWSYNSETIQMPVNTARELEVSLSDKQTGHAKLNIYLVAFR